MLKAIVAKTLLSVFLIAALTVTNTALAAESGVKHYKHNVVDHQTEKTKTDIGFTRITHKTDDKGAAATHRADVVTDKAEGVRRATISGSTYSGKTYSGEASGYKTDAGYNSQGKISASDGKVLDRSVNVTVDRVGNSVTKDISVTPQIGAPKTRTVVHPLKRSR